MSAARLTIVAALPLIVVVALLGVDQTQLAADCIVGSCVPQEPADHHDAPWHDPCAHDGACSGATSVTYGGLMLALTALPVVVRPSVSALGVAGVGHEGREGLLLTHRLDRPPRS